MNILGLNFAHDGSACVVSKGRLLSALAHERIYRTPVGKREKKAHGVSDALIDYVLDAAGISLDRIDAIALSNYNERAVPGLMHAYYHGERFTRSTEDIAFGNDALEMDVHYRGKVFRGYAPSHHMMHCAAAYYTSPFDSATCISMDASGCSVASNGLLAVGEGGKINAIAGPRCMIGFAYGQFCERLGVGPQIYKAGSLMALAGYGEVIKEVRHDVNRHVSDSFFEQGGDYRVWTKSLWDELSSRERFTDPTCKEALDIAASIQFLFEQCVLEWAKQTTGNVCLGGGSFLNCNANSAVADSGRKIHLFPACSDDGCAVGAALYVAHHLLNEPRGTYKDHEIALLGKEYPRKQVDVELVANLLNKGKIVLWMNGRSEFGPRALGSRSILADPRNFHNREKINFLIKKREWWRPLAPSVLERYANCYFNFKEKSPFMLMTAPTEFPQQTPAIVHIDGTARPQTVSKDWDADYLALLEEFKRQTECPMLLNTSANLPGEPILETEADALEFWEKVPVDTMIVNGVIHTR